MVHFIEKPANEIESKDFSKDEKNQVIMGRPYFTSFQNDLIWNEMMRFWSICQSLKPFCEKDYVILPGFATIKARSIHLVDLWRSHLWFFIFFFFFFGK